MTSSAIYCVNGKFLPQEKAVVPAADNGLLYGDGFYDTMRTYNNVILELELHLDRVEKSARVMGITLPWTRDQLRKWILETVKRNPVGEARVRITVTRGEHGFEFTTCKNPTLLITCEKLIIDPQIYTKGVSASTMVMQRLLPEIKTLGLTSMIIAYRKAAETGDYEIIFLGHDGMVREGASTSVFAVKKGVLYTPKSGILKGLTRKRTMILAKGMGMKVVEKDFTPRFLQSADEVFLSNRPRELIPVVKLNGKKIGTGKVGPHTATLLKTYRKYALEETSK